MALDLKTISIRPDGCFSVLLWDCRPFAVSVERTFDDLSTIIRAGVYKCKRDFYHHGGYETFEIVVPNHDRVLFHKGNLEVDSKACVCVAESFTQMNGVTAISDSKHGFEEFMNVTRGLEGFDMLVSGR